MGVKLGRVFMLKYFVGVGPPGQGGEEKRRALAAQLWLGHSEATRGHLHMPACPNTAPQSGRQGGEVVVNLLWGDMVLYHGQVGSPRSGFWRRQPDSATERGAAQDRDRCVFI